MAYKTIKLAGDPLHKERLAAAAGIYPGMLVELNSSDKFQVHATAGGTATPLFVLEDENQGKEIGDVYTSGAVCLAAVFGQGDEVLARLANGETAVIGSLLESNGDGYLRVVDADASYGAIGVQSIVGVALEAVDMSGSSGVDPTGIICVMTI